MSTVGIRTEALDMEIQAAGRQLGVQLELEYRTERSRMLWQLGKKRTERMGKGLFLPIRKKKKEQKIQRYSTAK